MSLGHGCPTSSQPQAFCPGDQKEAALSLQQEGGILEATPLPLNTWGWGL